jgi:hypothetical protein
MRNSHLFFMFAILALLALSVSFACGDDDDDDDSQTCMITNAEAEDEGGCCYYSDTPGHLEGQYVLDYSECQVTAEEDDALPGKCEFHPNEYCDADPSFSW